MTRAQRLVDGTRLGEGPVWSATWGELRWVDILAGDVLRLAGGSIERNDDWGRRPLAYEIRHNPDAEYHLLQFRSPPTLIEELSHTLRITDGVLRFRMEVEPRLDYGRTEPQVTIAPGGATFRAPGHALALGSQVLLEATAAGATAEFTLAAGDRRTFVLENGDEAEPLGVTTMSTRL